MFKALLAPTGPSTPLSTYITINGVIYMSTGFLFWLYPYALELFGSPKLTDDVAGYARGIGIAVIQIGWFYLWGARTRSESFALSTIVNRFFGPVLILPLVFMKLLEPALGIPFVIIDLVLATGCYIVWKRNANA